MVQKLSLGALFLHFIFVSGVQNFLVVIQSYREPIIFGCDIFLKIVLNFMSSRNIFSCRVSHFLPCILFVVCNYTCWSLKPLTYLTTNSCYFVVQLFPTHFKDGNLSNELAPLLREIDIQGPMTFFIRNLILHNFYLNNCLI